jgi:hypothetical protein
MPTSCAWVQAYKPAAYSPQQAPQAAEPAYFLFAALNFAQRARAAAAILLLPAAEIVLFGFGA